MSKVNIAVVKLIEKIQNRLSRVANQTRQHADQIATLQDDVRLKTGKLETGLVQLGSHNQTLLDRIKEVAFDLRDSTQKSFDAVATDIESLHTAIQRLNERVGQVESITRQVEVRLNASAPAAQMPSNHVWINKKLSGVYEVADDLDTRIQKLETLIALYENLRKAQAAFAEANGTFLVGPVKNSFLNG